ncbi:M28 family metallopeptidase [Silvibacterium dinghuense]|uniref:M28 family peptidase n=1 Tax=Silvibacterium dinghuense TaxID=1560006 RepID=A0A4Q1SCB7_9BACT|nr:M28 family metallopeptidase [Silvibacterium dinghuense]RXS94882.1 M28 family peptidase [Silvibacterium dinghuense]GGH08708.1 folate hydrolase [Silvibacterium dinghuense]
MRVVVAAACLAALTAHAVDTGKSLRGYTPADSATEVQWEQKFRAIPEPDNIRENMRRLSARPHHVGSPYDKDNAEWLLAQLKSYGLDAKIETFSALFPTPKFRSLELLGPQTFKATLEEPTLKEDPTSGQKSEQLPTYNAYSTDGDVTAPLVYVNYGRPEDYEELERMGVSVKGAIVLARYGASWRGIKPKVAAEHGAVGCLIYSDPKDDGYFNGDTYPEGPSRPDEGVQRGSVMDMPVYPGDPQTPGVGAVEGAKLIPLDQVKTITKIPVMPISYADATPFLKSLGGQVVPEAWRGGLPFTYHVGPSTVKAHLVLKFNWDRAPLRDVVATIRGAKYPDEWVIRGNHHDGWVNGAEDPISGASPELEEARSLGELLKQGWKPDRTIIYCFWDGEEPALLGSTEWVETHAEELKKHAVAYFNTDGNGRGYFGAEGSHTLENFVNDVAKDITDPETGMSVWKRVRLVDLSRADADRKKEIRSRADLRIPALGSGSDYSAFIDHLGIASVNVGYGGEDTGGQYHSIYDDFYWYTHFSDTNFVYGKALAQTVGTMVLRMADADTLPFEFGDFADTIHMYVDQLQALAKSEREKAKEQDEEIREGVYKALYDPKKTMVPPSIEPIPPFLNFAPLEQASEDLSDAAKKFDKAYAVAGGVAPAGLNAELIESERDLTDEQGLPNRPWFKHLIYAPGLYTGYGVKTIPGVREAIEHKDWTVAQEQIGLVSAALEREVELLKRAAAALPSPKEGE